MDDQKKYVFDSNVFIEAKRRYYAFDICPGFWQFIIHQNELSNVISVDKVSDELKMGDELERWINDNAPPGFFISTDTPPVISYYIELIKWVQENQQFYDGAKAEFAQVADGWIIAYAKANNCSVVTHEEFRPSVKNRVPIPNLCKEFDVDYLDTFETLRRLKASFDWNASSSL